MTRNVKLLDQALSPNYSCIPSFILYSEIADFFKKYGFYHNTVLYNLKTVLIALTIYCCLCTIELKTGMLTATRHKKECATKLINKTHVCPLYDQK